MKNVAVFMMTKLDIQKWDSGIQEARQVQMNSQNYKDILD